MSLRGNDTWKCTWKYLARARFVGSEEVIFRRRRTTSRWERVELGTSMSGDITGENNLAVVVQWAVVVQVWCRLARGRILTKFLIRNTRLFWSFLPLIKYKSKAKISKSWNKFSHCREFFCVTLLARSCNESPTRKCLNCKNKKEELFGWGVH